MILEWKLKEGQEQKDDISHVLNIKLVKINVKESLFWFLQSFELQKKEKPNVPFFCW